MGVAGLTPFQKEIIKATLEPTFSFVNDESDFSQDLKDVLNDILDVLYYMVFENKLTVQTPSKQ